MNIFIAVVSEVYSKAVTESLDRFADNLDRDRFNRIHPKLAAQADAFLFSGYHKVLRRELQERDADDMPSNAADVHALLQQLADIKRQLDKSLGKTMGLPHGLGKKGGESKIQSPPRSPTGGAATREADEGSKFFDTTMSSKKDRAEKRARGQRNTSARLSQGKHTR